MHRHTCKNLNVAYEIFLKEGQDVFDLDLGEPQAEEQPEYNIVMQWDELPWSVQFDVQPLLQTDVQQEEETLQVKQEEETLQTDVQQEEEPVQVKQEEEPLHTSFDVKEEEPDAADPLQELLRCCAEYNGRLMNILNCYQ